MWEYIVEQIEASSGARFLRVPFQGGGAGISALVGGNVDIAQGFYSEFRGHLDGGKVAPLAVASAERMDFLKDMPTFNEALGAKEYLWQVIRFAVVPKGTPAERKAYLGAAIRAAMNDPELVAEYRKFGVFFDPKLAKSTRLAEDLNAYVEAERQFYMKTGRLK
jgi:tripartite-type tricarboxylate transporter receptor subunit TctC